MIAESTRVICERLIAESQASGVASESLDWDASGWLRAKLEARCERSLLGPVEGLDTSRDPEACDWTAVQSATYYGVGSGDGEADDYDDRPWSVELPEALVLGWRGVECGGEEYGDE